MFGRQLIKLRKCSRLNHNRLINTGAVRAQEALSTPQPDGAAKSFSPKIEQLGSQIAALNLVEVADLSSYLKVKLNLPDVALVQAGAPRPAAAEEEEVAPKKVQTSFTVKLTKFDDKQKVALIKEIKSLMENMNLVQAKKFVESAPTIVKADVSKEEADKLKEALSKVGAVIEIE